MILSEDQIKTKEVLKWQGLHLLHFRGSSCSQKVRTLLREKGIKVTYHHVDLARNKHVTPWYLGINPRGVVPVLVHDGVVHVESNDILEYLDDLPSNAPSFFPQTEEERKRVRESLDLEDSLHDDLRNLTMGFMTPRGVVTKSEETLQRYEREGVADPSRMKEVAWWRNFAENGIPDDVAKDSIDAYRAAFDALDAQLAGSQYLLGDRLSVLDLAWFISSNRLELAGLSAEMAPQSAQMAQAFEAPAGFCPGNRYGVCDYQSGGAALPTVPVSARHNHGPDGALRGVSFASCVTFAMVRFPGLPRDLTSSYVPLSVDWPRSGGIQTGRRGQVPL